MDEWTGGQSGTKPLEETTVLMCAEHVVAQYVVGMKNFFSGSREKMTSIENFS